MIFSCSLTGLFSLSLSIHFRNSRTETWKRAVIGPRWHPRSVLGCHGYVQHLTFFSDQGPREKRHHWCLSHWWNVCPLSRLLLSPSECFLRTGKAAHSPSVSVRPVDLGEQHSATLESRQFKFIFILSVLRALCGLLVFTSKGGENVILVLSY